MELTLQDVKTIAEKRAGKNKKAGWNRKFTFPTYILLVICLASVLARNHVSNEQVFVSNNNKVVVSKDADKAMVNGEEYIRDYAQGVDSVRKLVDYTFLITGGLALVIYAYWYYRVKKPYIVKFVKYWQDNKEFME